uniref:C2H2-type domain-containing protein n=2 Tax=Salix viminalis TaxID=40686 RepID=A0A6N2N2M3_SALVM
MMKSLVFHEQQKQILQEENMSNLTSASGDQASVSSGNRNETETNYGVQAQHFAPPAQTQAPVKKKRNLPGNPDPDAEVIALSPKTLMATNRFVCEICKKGFQRDQNLQLHRRGHNLPWKLKQRTSNEIRKKVYVCPEPNCVHHDPSRALGDLTGIKKHFCRKHGEKKWKCVKCSKRYAVQSDWKAHAKTCGTREYRCECGTLFSRRDSFVTHRAFCDALAEEKARTMAGATTSQFLSTQPAGSSNPHVVNLQMPQFSGQNLHVFSLKKEQQNSFRFRPDFPPWLACPPGLGAPGPPHYQSPIDHLSSSSSPSILSTRLGQEFTPTCQDMISPNPNPNPSPGPTLPQYHHSGPSPHMSATALLQKAAQMGATVSSKATGLMRPHYHQQQQEQAHVSANADNVSNTNTAGFGLNLSSREELASGGLFLISGSARFGNKAGPPVVPSGAARSTGAVPPSSGSLLTDMMDSLSSASGFEEPSFEDALGSSYSLSKTTRNDHGSGSNGGNEGLTIDFLGSRPLSHSDIVMSMVGLSNCINSSHEQQIHKPWQV